MRLIHSYAINALKKMESESVDFIYIDPPYFTQRDFGEFGDKWTSIDEYVASLSGSFYEAKRVLKRSGNICVHVDWHASHRIRTQMEWVFGFNNFLNHIVWCYSSGGASQKHFSRKHDDLLVYAKDSTLAKFNPIREPYPRDYGGRPGFHKDGRIMNDWWQIGILSTTSSERTGYPTQKPVELLKRLITAYTDKDDIVLDYYCGSGTTGVAAQELERDFILVDKNLEALKIAKQRLSFSGEIE